MQYYFVVAIFVSFFCITELETGACCVGLFAVTIMKICSYYVCKMLAVFRLFDSTFIRTSGPCQCKL